MAIKHADTKASGDRGFASEWNKDHVIETGTGISQAPTITVASSTSKNSESADYVCDGIHDEIEILAAMNELETTGGTVELLEGTFNIQGVGYNGIVVPQDNMEMRGQGKGTILSYDVDGGGFITATGKSHLTVRDMSFEVSPGGLNEDGIELVNCTYVKIMNCWFNCGGTMITVSGGSYFLITNNMLEATADDRVFLWVSGGTKYMTIKENLINTSTDTLAYFDASTDIIFAENMTNELLSGMYMSASCSRIIISGNIFYKSYAAANTTIDNYADQAIIVNNHLRAVGTGTGILNQAQADRCIIMGNIIQNFGTNITDNGTNTVLQHNITT